MREIKFRAKDKYTKEWVYGDLIKGECCYISTPEEFFNACVSMGGHMSTSVNVVIPETVGEFTGLKDKNDKEIYEGDIVHISRTALEEENGMTTDIYFLNGAFRYRHNDGSGSVLDWKTTRVIEGYESITQDVEVIGNIHEKENK